MHESQSHNVNLTAQVGKLVCFNVFSVSFKGDQKLLDEQVFKAVSGEVPVAGLGGQFYGQPAKARSLLGRCQQAGPCGSSQVA